MRQAPPRGGREPGSQGESTWHRDRRVRFGVVGDGLGVAQVTATCQWAHQQMDPMAMLRTHATLRTSPLPPTVCAQEYGTNRIRRSNSRTAPPLDSTQLLTVLRVHGSPVGRQNRVRQGEGKQQGRLRGPPRSGASSERGPYRSPPRSPPSHLHDHTATDSTLKGVSTTPPKTREDLTLWEADPDTAAVTRAQEGWAMDRDRTLPSSSSSHTHTPFPPCSVQPPCSRPRRQETRWV